MVQETKGRKGEDIMEREREIRILMEDGCAREDAKRHLDVGTIIFEEFEENFDFYCEMLAKGDEDLEEELRKMVETKEAAGDWGIIEVDGKTYYIMYCL